MRYIFDFDDTLFDTSKFKEHIFSSLGSMGIKKSDAEMFYRESRTAGSPFSLKEFLFHIFPAEAVDKKTIENLYEDIMSVCPKFINKEMLKAVKRIGRDNCYIVTNGERNFQLDKIKRTGLPGLCREVYITPGSKKRYIEEICQRHPKEEIVYVEDKPKHFEDISAEKTKNLTKVVFNNEVRQKLVKRTYLEMEPSSHFKKMK